MPKEQPENAHELRDPVVPPVRGSTNSVEQSVPRTAAKPQFCVQFGE